MRLGWLAVVGSACSFTPGTLSSGDGAGPDTTIIPPQTTGWSTPVEILHDAAGNDDPSLTNDLLEIYFGSARPGGFGFEDIWMAKRASINDAFGTPMPVTELNSSASETTMKITGGGRAIYFASNRGGSTGGGHDIYAATRSARDQPWTTPVRVPELSTANGDWAPFAQTDQLRIVLCSGVLEAQEALYTSTRASTSDPWSAPARVTELDETNISECDPNEPTENVLWYASDHLNTDGTFDIYRASRASSTTSYGSRTALSEINLPGFDDRDPWVSADERTMVFASNRDGVNTELYITTR